MCNCVDVSQPKTKCPCINKLHKRVSDSNVIPTHNYLVRKRTLNHLVKVWLNVWVFPYELKWLVVRINVAITETSDMAPASSKEFLDTQANYRVWIHSETRTWLGLKSAFWLILWRTSKSRQLYYHCANKVKTRIAPESMKCVFEFADVP